MGTRGAEQIVLSNGAAFAVLATDGDIRAEHSPEAGLFFDDTRYLSRSVLEVRGADLRELSTEVTREYVSQVDLSLSSDVFGGVLDDPKLAFHLRRRQLIDRDMVERVELANYHHDAIDLELVFRHEADFKDLFEVRGWKRSQHGEIEAPAVVDVASYEFAYRGRDDFEYRTRVRYGRAPDRLEPGMAIYRVHLSPLGSWAIEFTVTMGRK